MNKFKDEMMKSIRYIIPILLMFLGILFSFVNKYPFKVS